VRRSLAGWVPVVLWAAFIFGLSSVPGTSFPTVQVPQSDKMAHIAVANLYGISDELHQSFTPFRTPDWHDVVADALGGALGAAAMAILPWMKNRASSMMRRSDE